MQGCLGVEGGVTPNPSVEVKLPTVFRSCLLVGWGERLAGAPCMRGLTAKHHRSPERKPKNIHAVLWDRASPSPGLS